MLQDIAPHRLNNSYLEKREPRPGDYVIYTRNDKELLILPEGEEFRLPFVSEVEEQTLRFGFLLDDTAFFVGEKVPELPGFEFVNQMKFRSLKPRPMAYAAVTAMHLMHWLNAQNYCSRCGGPLEDSKTERARVCPSCGQVIYPRLNPTVIVAITHGDKLLASRYANRVTVGYALIAGYVELGETLEEALHREVMEEVGLKVKNIRYYKSQPWGFTDTILAGFYCDLEGDDETITLDKNELKEAVWLSREEIPDRGGEASLTAEMMDVFRRGLEPRVQE